MSRWNAASYVKFIVYLVVVVLVNLVALTLFARIDLTRNQLFSLSAASRQVVGALSEPLTINVFFTRNLPAPHNGTERYLHDLLAEYARHGGRRFNYRFYDVSPDEGDTTARAEENRRLAQNYGIYPVQIQAIDRDEVKFQKAYMGMVMIHGDLVERIEAIPTTDGLEYRITTAIQKMTHKISALLAIEDKIQIQLYLSASLESVAPLMGLEGLSDLPRTLPQVVERVNRRHYHKLAFTHIDPPADQDMADLGRELDILTLKWPQLPKHQVSAGSGAVGLVLRHAGRRVSLPVVQVVQLPIFGTQYQMSAEADLEAMLADGVEALLDINADIGVLAGHGTLNLSGPPPRDPMGQIQDETLETFRGLLNHNYTIKPLDPAQTPIGPGVQSLMILRPGEPISEWALYQIDQFLMRGGNLFVVLDPFKEMFLPGRPPVYQPLDSGLEKLLNHWGVKIPKAYVLDERAYRQRLPQDMGGGEQTLYFAPLIENQHISDRLDFMNNIRGLVAFRIAPLELDPERLKAIGLRSEVLFTSSERSWRMEEPVNLNPMFASVPPENQMDGPFPLALILEGAFPSYFEGRPIPVKEKSQEPAGDETDAAAGSGGRPELAGTAETGAFVPRGRPAKVFVMASAEMLTDKILDPEGRTPNSIFLLNAIDYLNQREDLARLRSKEQRFNPLDPVRPEARTLIKAVNILGLPLAVIGLGLLVWLGRARRQRRIQAMFTP
jgi:ABC-type uncharacterized transport system involved in gliding motility auxiliary subunit